MAAVGCLITSSACEFRESRRRRSVPLAVETARDVADDGELAIPREVRPDVARSQPEDLGTSQCPGVRVVRVRRTQTAPGDVGPGVALRARYFGVDQFSRVIPLAELLACELRAMHFVVKGIAEGVNLIALRGPFVGTSEEDCDWRELRRSERIAGVDGGIGSRRVWFRERCRNVGSSTNSAERTVVVDVVGQDSRLEIR